MRRIEAAAKNRNLHHKAILTYNERMEERHPVPQQVSGYEFRLIGDMTLKQFAELAFGEVLALICWRLPLASIIKYPLVGFFAFLGVALAFVPIHEQSLDNWIINFFRAIYSPTQFIWKKSDVALDFLERSVFSKPAELSKSIHQPADKKKLKEYLKTITTVSISPFEKEIEENLSRIGSLLGQVTRQPTVIEVANIKKKVEEIPYQEPSYQTIEPKFKPELPMPSSPTKPNLLVGMILDYQGKILADAIIEIRDKNGFPVRALKANKLGQFRIATPLKNGTYEIELEKEGYQFDIIKFEVKGEIIQPMEIRAKENKSE